MNDQRAVHHGLNIVIELFSTRSPTQIRVARAGRRGPVPAVLLADDGRHDGHADGQDADAGRGGAPPVVEDGGPRQRLAVREAGHYPVAQILQGALLAPLC